MKKQKNSTIRNADDALAVIAGQFFVVALKGDAAVLAEFRKGYVAHCDKMLGSITAKDLASATMKAGRAFVAILAKRYGWHSDAASVLSSCVEEVCGAWVLGQDASPAITRLRVIDVWSGIASCSAGGGSLPVSKKIPLSLLDYVLMTLLPVVCAREIRAVISAIAGLDSYDVEALNAVDAALGECASRLCCRVVMNDSMCNEFKLAILLHLPKDEGFVSANEGLAYKLLQRQYANTGVK